MRERTEFPHEVEEIEHTCIPMADGTRLAARIWKPTDAEAVPVPAILEFIPYRKRDFTAGRDAANHRWFAGHGYACLRVDMRGSGESEGVLLDEYIEQEQEDGLEIIEWIRSQPWCDGKVGMFGISWGGFNGLQIAARQPEGLDAVVSVASTDDRYADDVHYMGGCLLGDNLSWASVMFAYNASPPDPALGGGEWKDLWLERMEKSGLWVLNWLEHQTRDEYWKHGSVCEDFSGIKAPVFAVSGWADGYSNAVFRLVKGLGARSKGLIGPWGHKYPHQGIPGPAIGFLQECLRWWDQWLKGKDTGITEEPRLRVWIQESIPPSSRYEERPGRWVGEDAWPSANIRPQTWQLDGDGRLRPGDRTAGTEAARAHGKVESPLSVGQFSGKWCSYASAPDLPGDQREEDGGCLVWQSRVFDEPLELLGSVRVRLRLRCSRPSGMIALRLSDVAPDGRATRVTYGLLNLTHRNGHEQPEALDPDRTYEVTVRLNDCGHCFLAGHRVRLSLSTSLWPLAWSPQASTRVVIDPDGSEMSLPVRPPSRLDQGIAFEPPEQAAGRPLSVIKPASASWTVERDLGTDADRLKVRADGGECRLEDIDLTFSKSVREEYGFTGNDFESPYGETVHERSWHREGWKAGIRARTCMRCDESHFHIDADLDAWHNG
ncbi:MAG: CocE/NonD family hydrolase, partial [Puniceicoccaceae bacterium]